MKDIIIILAFALIGFGVGYYMYADVAGVDIGLKYIILGADTGLDIVDNATRSILKEARQNILLVTLTGAAVGLLITLLMKRFQKK